MIFLIDAFTDEAFRGNPAGVCIMNEYPADDILQKTAAYYNWSEISFLKKIDENKYQIRWFSPKDEAPLCGHATLAAAHALFSNGIVNGKFIEFLYNSGELHAKLNEDKSITMLFPEKPVHKCESFNFSVEELVGVSDYIEVVKDDLIHIIVLTNDKDVENAIPNFDAIKRVDTRAIAITAASTNGFDFSSRYFAPSVGLYEDPVCGSMHCRLAYYWKHVLKKTEFRAYQASKRSGILMLGVDSGLVKISGRAVTICSLKTGLI